MNQKQSSIITRLKYNNIKQSLRTIDQLTISNKVIRDHTNQKNLKRKKKMMTTTTTTRKMRTQT